MVSKIIWFSLSRMFFFEILNCLSNVSGSAIMYWLFQIASNPGKNSDGVCKTFFMAPGRLSKLKIFRPILKLRTIIKPQQAKIIWNWSTSGQLYEIGPNQAKIVWNWSTSGQNYVKLIHIHPHIRQMGKIAFLMLLQEEIITRIND